VTQTPHPRCLQRLVFLGIKALHLFWETIVFEGNLMFICDK